MGQILTPEQWLAECSQRIRAYEGLRLYKYRDANSVATIGYGYAIQGGAVESDFAAVGINYATVMAAPTAIDSEPRNAVAACIDQDQAFALFDHVMPRYLNLATHSVTNWPTVDQVRQFCVLSMAYQTDWLSYIQTRQMISTGQYYNAAVHMETLPWFSQSGERGVQIVQMLKFGSWEPPLESVV
ncbi:MAG: hypothetical protein ABSE64_07945 [Vulcanimicrobiaceae bacterium]